MYKRNQVNDALVAAFRSSHTKLDDETLLTRVKRLLDNDRKYERVSREDGAVAFAFYDSHAAGSGRDVTFSGYSVFALFLAMRLMSCGLPQGRAAFLLRHFRPSLEREYARMSRIDIAPLLEIENTVIAGANAVGRHDLIARGNVIERLDDMVFFCIHADLETFGMMTGTIMDPEGPRPDNICRGGAELQRRMRLDAYTNSPTLAIELMNPLIQLHHLLATTKPVRRGRRRGS